MSTVGDRLRQAIDQRIGSIRKFERDLKKHAPDLRGTARQTIYRYLENKSDPPPGFLRVAADVLKVREEWLASGHGGMDEEAERLRTRQEAAADAAQDADWWADLRVVQEAFAGGDESLRKDGERLAGPICALMVLRAWSRLYLAGLVPPGPALSPKEPYPHIARVFVAREWNPEDPPDKAALYATGRALGRILGVTFRALPVEPGDLSEEEFESFITVTCEGLIGLASALKRRGGPRKEENDG